MALSTIQNNSFADTAVHGRRNLIINGAMQVAQRYGYNSAQTDWNGYDASDRIFKRTSGAATSSVQTRDDDAPSGFSFSDKLTITSANSDTYIGRGTCLEWQNINHLRAGYSDAKTVTLSFWVKTSIAGTYCFALTSYVSTHSAGDASTSYVTEYTVNSANTWEYKTITITMPTSTPSNWDNSNGKNATGLRLQWTQSRAATTNTYETATTDSWISGNYFCNSNQTNMGATNGSTFQITGIQLELGSTATPFEHRSYAEELSLCQRYYEQMSVAQSTMASSGGFIALGVCENSSRVQPYWPFKVRKRAAPSTILSTISDFGLRSTGGSTACSSGAFGASNENYANGEFNTSSSSVTSGGCGWLVNHTGNAKIEWDAEL